MVTECSKQSVQADTLTLPVALAYVSAKHEVHVVNPTLLLYFPLSQATHAGPSTPILVEVYPMLHLQSLSASLPVADCWLGKHGRHVVSAIAAVLVEYLFTPHKVHAADPFCTLYVPV